MTTKGAPRRSARRWLANLPPRVPGFIGDLYASEGLRGTLVAVLVGVVAGLGAVGFRWLITGFRSLFFDSGASFLGFLGPWHVVLLPAFGGLVVGLIVFFFAKEAKGHGVPEVMDAVANQDGRIRPRVSLVKALASSVCIGSGGSVGREGPIVQIGAAFGSTLGQKRRLSRDWTRTLVACGAAGGISATFNAPIAGVFFALEVILARFTAHYFSFVVVSSVVAAAVGHALLEDAPSFAVPEYGVVSAIEFPFYAGLGLVAAFVGVFFTRFLYRVEDGFDALPIPEYFKPALGGLGVGFIAVYWPQVMGVGYEAMSEALTSNLTFGVAVSLLAWKVLATSLTLGSGGSGGVFAPSLFIGAMLGDGIGSFLHEHLPTVTAQAGAYSLVGMAAVFAGAAHAPITSILIVFEMTRDYKLILPLMFAVVISTLVSQRLSGKNVYTLKLLRRGVQIHPPEHVNVLGTVHVGEVMTTDFPTVSTDATLNEVGPLFAQKGYHGFPVVDARGDLQGIVTLTDVEDAMERGRPPGTRVSEVATHAIITAYPDQTVHEALLQLGAREVGRIPVVSRANRKKLVGVLRRHDLVRAYTSRAG